MSSNQTTVISNLRRPTSGNTASPKEQKSHLDNHHALGSAITKAASKQTYYTIRFLVDRDRIQNAFRTYAYFRWVDDQLDEHLSTESERVVFIQRQHLLMNDCYQGKSIQNHSPEEQMLVDLIQSDQDTNSGLKAYIHHMMAVMAFDSERRGRLITQHELDNYTAHLATAVTEAMHYFIGHKQFAPMDERRYCAVTGAHIIHMLRDTYADIATGYFNIPREFLQSQQIHITDFETEAYRLWTKDRVQQAQKCFEEARDYLGQVENRRCRIAGFAYLARFQAVLDTIKDEGYRLRPNYEGHNSSLRVGLNMIRALLSKPTYHL